MIIKTLAFLVSIVGFGAVIVQISLLRDQEIRQEHSLIQQTIALQAQTASLEKQSLALQTQAWQYIATQQIELTKLLAAYPEVRPYFEEGLLIDKSNKHFNRVMIVADAYLDYIDGFEDEHIRKLPHMNDGGKYWRIWEKYFVSRFSDSPVLCTRYREVDTFYSTLIDEFAVRGGCKKKN